MSRDDDSTAVSNRDDSTADPGRRETGNEPDSDAHEPAAQLRSDRGRSLSRATTGERRRDALLAGLVGAAAGFVLVGPGFGGGLLLNLDLAVVEEPVLPLGVFGLSADIPRAHPFDLGAALVGSVLGGPVTTQLYFLLCIAVAAAGMSRLISDRRRWLVLGGALLYATSPFLLTRMAVGHTTMAGVFALLPWVVRTLTAPGARPARVFVAAAAMGLFGIYGGLLTGALIVAAFALGRASVRSVLAAAAGHLPWLTAGIVAMLRSPEVVGSGAFPSTSGLLFGPLRLLAGHGFWQDVFQVGSHPFIPEVLGGAVGLLALVGWRTHRRIGDNRGAGVARDAETVTDTSRDTDTDTGRDADTDRDTGAPDASWTTVAGLAGAVALALMVADGTPGVDTLFERLTENPVGAALREPQRLLPLALVWLVPMVAAGAAHIADAARGSAARWAIAAPAALAFTLAVPGLAGLGGQLQPTDIPAGWEQVRATIESEPGATLVLPFSRYMTFGFAETPTRLALNPWPRFVDGDVITGSDIGLGAGSRETLDPRDEDLRRVLRGVVSDAPAADALADLGIVWVVLLREAAWRQYASLDEDPGLRRRFGDDDVVLYRVTGAAEARVGTTALAVEHPVPFVTDLIWPAGGSGATDAAAARWHAPVESGWVAGTSRVSPPEDGRGLLIASEHLEPQAAPLAGSPQSGSRAVRLWYWPAPVLLAVHALVWATAGATGLGLLRGSEGLLRGSRADTDVRSR